MAETRESKLVGAQHGEQLVNGACAPRVRLTGLDMVSRAGGGGQASCHDNNLGTADPRRRVGNVSHGGRRVAGVIAAGLGACAPAGGTVLLPMAETLNPQARGNGTAAPHLAAERVVNSGPEFGRAEGGRGRAPRGKIPCGPTDHTGVPERPAPGKAGVSRNKRVGPGATGHWPWGEHTSERPRKVKESSRRPGVSAHLTAH